MMRTVASFVRDHGCALDCFAGVSARSGPILFT
jgi:hypothetical protein